jgi:Transposase, Mutator family
MHTMPRGKLRPTLAEAKALLSEDQDFLRPLAEAVVQELLEAEMAEALCAGTGERMPQRLGYRAGYYPRTLVTRVGKLELRVVATLAEMYVQGVSTRKVKAITARLAPSADLGGRRGAARCAATASRPRRSARSTPGSTRSWHGLRGAASTRPVRI